ncbi:MAG: hypothetical protein ACKOEX_14400 [Planctomycetia bacterium]
MAFPRSAFRSRIVVVAAAAIVFAATARPAISADVAETGLAVIPSDAAFVSSTLRLREQYERVTASNAFAAIRKLPAVAKFLGSLEEQQSQPGSPLSILDTFMQLPENQQAVEVLQDMVATDTFVYGDASWVTLMELLMKVQRAQQAANILTMASGGISEFDVGGLGIEFDAELDDDEEDDDEEDEDDDNADARRRVKARPARFQVLEGDLDLQGNELAMRLVLKTIADNKNLIVIPDLVWGFTTTKRDAAVTQLKRLEVLLQLAAQANPALAGAVQRKTIAGGEFVTLTFKPDLSAARQLVAVDEASEKDLDAIFGVLDDLEMVVALGTMGNRVILSVGDSTDHLAKLATAPTKGLIAGKPFEPLLEYRGKPITAVSYVSEALMKVVAPSTADIDQLAELADDIASLADLPPEAAADARTSLRKMSEQYRAWMPAPGPWMSFSFLAEEGYEGYAWDWSKNRQIDGTKRLDLLEHMGGAPLAATVTRMRTDVPRFDHLVGWIGMAWKFFTNHLLPRADETVQEQFAGFEKHMVPLGEKFVGIVRRTFVPALAGGQFGFVIDGKSKTSRLQNGLPAAEQPLPLVEPAIVLGISDPGLFREGMNDLFALADELVEAVRAMAPDSVPDDYRIAEPEKSKVEGGTIWSWPLKKAGLDEQLRPAIALGKDAAVFSLVPKQAGRLIVEAPLETGSQLTRFEEPLAGASALDIAGLIDLMEPWVVYLVRYGSVQQRDGSVDRDLVMNDDVEDPQVREVLDQMKTVFEAAKSLRAATSETTTKPDATVTHWRNVIRDMPK